MTSTTAAAPAGPVSAPRSRRAGSPRRSRDRRGWLFVAPFLIVFALTFLAPVAYAFGLSLFRDQAFFGGTTFVGLDNYAEVLADAKFWESFLRVLVFLLVQVPVMLLLALISALAIDSARLHASGFFRIVVFLPYAIPAVVAALMWGFLYGDNFGLAADLNHLVGHDIVHPLSGNWVLTSIGNVVTWEFTGYNMLIFYSALRVIPGELFEAAAIDGAGAFRTIFAIKLPALRGALVIATIFSIIGSFQLFNEPSILQTLAPNAISSFYTPNMYAYNLSFNGQQYNYSATVAIVMGVITAIIAYAVQLRASRKEMQ
ncbi:MAG TPA: sugar ABC transporter permease [Amycolatopsis sp.]|uniref:carbohydrate ABC transporter permease n=1 Tax=Amycolatopsis sp. TaxID=37632 RepID=UPI002B4A14F1|nr:sugar ABC transporter permease [Amycolatopsis sp.]HKS49637.1 sugar ABC transporter permease [Amycolatopsis sp.]